MVQADFISAPAGRPAMQRIDPAGMPKYQIGLA
jgi:hypothetical protein